MNIETKTPVAPRWLHALAVLTVLFTLPLLFLGASVTSHGVGMVDPRGFRPPWEIINGLFENNGLDWRLEYGHRTFGFLVGICAIFLALGCFFFDRRPWMGWLGFLALGLICAQGALGIFRVDYNALHGRTFALIHGCFAQIVFAVLVSVAWLTSRSFRAEQDAGGVGPVCNRPAEEGQVGNLHHNVGPALQRWSIITALLVFGQLVLGGLVRHQESLLGPRGHLLGAFIVTGAIVWLLVLIRESEARERFTVVRILLMLLLTGQLLLGIESWLAKFYAPQADLPQLLPVPVHAEWIRTAHYLLGTLIFSTTVVAALTAHRKLAVAVEGISLRPRGLEGAL